MQHRQILLAQAAKTYGIPASTLKSLAVQGELPAFPRGDTYVFFQDDIDLWCSSHIIAGETPTAFSGKVFADGEAAAETVPLLTSLCSPECIDCALPGNSRPAIIRSLVELAEHSGFLYDPKDLEEEIARREEQGSTNIGGGVAIPHTLIREDGYFSQSFFCMAKLAKPVYFNSAPDGSATELLLLSCSASSEEHLQILARISQLCARTDFVGQVRAAQSKEDMAIALLTAERELENSVSRRKRNR